MLDNHPAWISVSSKSNLHTIFTEIEQSYPTTWVDKSYGRHSRPIEAVKKELAKGNSDVNELDEYGNTLLHRAIWMKIYYGSRTPNDVGDSLINVEALLSLGADPTIFNKRAYNPIELFIKLVIESGNAFSHYVMPLFNLLKKFSYAHLFFEAVDNCPELKFGITISSLNNLDVNGLPLGTLEMMLAWLKKKCNLDEMYTLNEKIIAQIDYLKTYPYLDQVLATIVTADDITKHAIFRCLYFYDEKFPLLYLLDQTLTLIKKENLLVDSLLIQDLERFLEGYVSINSILDAMSADLAPLTNEEIKLRNSLFIDLDNALNGKIHYFAESCFIKDSGTLPKTLAERYNNLLEKDRSKRNQLVAEINRFKESISLGKYFGENGILATERKRRQCLKAAVNRNKSSANEGKKSFSSSS